MFFFATLPLIEKSMKERSNSAQLTSLITHDQCSEEKEPGIFGHEWQYYTNKTLDGVCRDTCMDLLNPSMKPHLRSQGGGEWCFDGGPYSSKCSSSILFISCYSPSTCPFCSTPSCLVFAVVAAFLTLFVIIVHLVVHLGRWASAVFLWNLQLHK